MNMCNKFSIIFFCGLIASSAIAEQLAPPKYQVIDRMGVNAHSGQIVIEIPTLAIGGDLGLSHKVSSSNSNFIQQNSGGAYTGISDKFFGGAVYTQVSSQGSSFFNEDKYSTQNPYDHFRDTQGGIWLMRVHDYQGSADFKVMYGGYARGYFYDSQGYTYEALGDKRHTLIIPAGMPGYLLWTKPDGTKTLFYRGESNVIARSGGFIKKIEHPNGFTLYFDRTIGNAVAYNTVSTNTGYQLKYNYVTDITASYGVGAGNTWYENPAENNATWSHQNPYSVIGVNAAYERCSNQSSTVCVSKNESCPSFSSTGQSCVTTINEWPTAKFSWPKGMPRAIFFGENTYSVKDSSGGFTEVYLKAFDKYKDENGNPISDSYPVGQAFVPRVKSIKPAGSLDSTISYTYKNYRKYAEADIRWGNNQNNDSVMPGAYIYSIPGETALVQSASGINGQHTQYMQGIQQGIFPYAVQYPAADGLSVRKLHQFFGILMFVKSPLGMTTFSTDYRNFPYANMSPDKPTEHYFYDIRGNVNQVIYNKDRPSQYTVNAEYPSNAECNNLKTCNQAKWVSDALGNKTFYTYHESSGQVSTVTLPANPQGISSQTRYEYAQFYARYINETGNKVQATDPIWLKTYEKYCIDSSYTNGACTKNDEVVISYQYNSDNLHLTGMSIRDPILLKTQTTCYEYDIYGNRIGETQPKGSCN